MKRWLEIKGYQLCIDLAVLRITIGGPFGWLERKWTGFWWRHYCPRPVVDDWTARACVMSCNCGCDNLDRYAQSPAKLGSGAQ